MTNEAIRLDNVSFMYSDAKPNIAHSVQVLERFSLTVPLGRSVSLFGPNGCGKSTLLRICAGLLPPLEGRVLIAGTPAGKGDAGYIPQAFRESLMPWLRNVDNIAFPLFMNGVPKEEARRRAETVLRDLNGTLPLGRFPHEISTGQQQLVSLARALVRSPSVLLADEPFSALDFNTRRDMQDIFHKILAPSSVTSLIVTHSIDDAIHMGDEVVVTTRNPMNVVATISIPEPRPRSQEFKKSRAYFELVQAVSGAFLKANT